ncbi:MAG: DinB family protein [Armatimonadetes bacterium]|nr:DinB family protein [Armatimonadota bacterium]
MATAEGTKAAGLTQMMTGELLLALQYTSDENLDWVPMGSAKTPRAIVVECAAGYQWLAAELRGEPNAAAVWESLKPEDYPTREALTELVQASETGFLASIGGLSEADLEQKRQVFWGEETVRDLMWMGMIHTNYHVGQLNYIQTLWGDTEMHHAT